MPDSSKRNAVIMGAAGRDFHNFNLFFRNNPHYRVVAFTAAQIPNIESRKYPPELAGRLYPEGISIYPESKLPELIKKHNVNLVVFAYSDVSNQYVMDRAAIALACGADFVLLGPESTMLRSSKPVVSVCAVRTGSGKSPVSRYIVAMLRRNGIKAVVIRHPMPYGNLAKQAVQRFSSLEDLDKYKCTIEEREDYEPHINSGAVVYSGVDYEKILRKAEKEAGVIVWDGGNNDMPFIRPDLSIVIADPLRPGHELIYHPGQANARMADIVVINKVNVAKPADVKTVEKNIRSINRKADIVFTKSIVYSTGAEIKGKVIVVEDGPTITHGGSPFGAGYEIARRKGARIIDPRKYAKGSLKEVYRRYPHIKRVVPAMGYGKKQISDLEKTINSCRNCDVVVSATPIDISRVMKIRKPVAVVRYEIGESRLGKLVRERLKI